MKSHHVPANFVPAGANISEMVLMLDVAKDSRFVAIYSLTVDSASIYDGELSEKKPRAVKQVLCADGTECTTRE